MSIITILRYLDINEPADSILRASHGLGGREMTVK